MNDETSVKKVKVVLGSASDIPQIRGGINQLRIAQMQGKVEWSMEVCSAHRNPVELDELLETWSAEGIDVIIACADKFAALFGNIDSMLRNKFQNAKTRVVAVPLKGKEEQASLAALYGVLEVPSHQMIFQKEFFDNPTQAFVHVIETDFPNSELKEQKSPESFMPERAYDIARIKHPEKASYDGLVKVLEEEGGLFHLGTGKTREMFINPKHPDLLYIVATDRISIFDIVLNARISQKGSVLTAMTVFWLKKVFSDIPNHLVAYGKGIEEYLLEGYSLRESTINFLMENMIVVKKAQVLKVEAIVRGYLTGSGLKDYNGNGGMVCGMQLSDGLIDGSELPETIFTPSTKAEYGLHDENITVQEAGEIIGENNIKTVSEMALGLYSTARARARKVGIIIADTKFEIGVDENRGLILIDEVLTPDSSRFWPEAGRLDAMKAEKTPPSLDKQPIRDAGLAAGVKEDHSWIPPKELCEQTTDRYLEAFKILSGKALKDFQKEDMGIEY